MDKGCHQGKNNLASICRPVASGGAGEARAPHFLADHLTLSQPGGHIIPTQYYVPPQIFDPCCMPAVITIHSGFNSMSGLMTYLSLEDTYSIM